MIQDRQRWQQQQQERTGGAPDSCAADVDSSTSARRDSIRTRMLMSMRDYKSYGALRRTALMVVAYNQAPEKLRDLRNEFLEMDTVRNGRN